MMCIYLPKAKCKYDLEWNVGFISALKWKEYIFWGEALRKKKLSAFWNQQKISIKWLKSAFSHSVNKLYNFVIPCPHAEHSTPARLLLHTKIHVSSHANTPVRLYPYVGVYKESKALLFTVRL